MSSDKPRLPTLRITDEIAEALERKSKELRRTSADLRRFALEYYLLGKPVPGVPVPGSAAVLADGPALVTGGDGEAGDG